MATHPLDRPVWTALNGRQAAFALHEGAAVRFHPDFGVFAAAPDHGEESQLALAELARATGPIALFEAGEPPIPPGLTIESQGLCVQMVAEQLIPARDPPAFGILPLTDADGPAMLALATLTKPGPFFERTHQLGAFVGVKRDGVLIAMAGERLRPDGFTEVSGVCTEPEHRGRGYAAALMRHVAGAILARGDTPFLHSYAANTGAVALYESLGFVTRAEALVTFLSPQTFAPTSSEA